MEIFNEDYATALEKVLEARGETVSSPSGTGVMEPGDLGNQIISRTGLAPGFTGDTPEYKPMRGEFISEADLEQNFPGLARGELERAQVPFKGEGKGIPAPWPGGRELLYAQGGRIGAQEGGLMNLGGMEKDYRQEGGFVPLGGEERADDVPARLSKNEFVFTADAVRAAGGGDIDAGAEVMENVMNNLEQGGQVSEESQGLEGARNMFASAQRLEGVM